MTTASSIPTLDEAVTTPTPVPEIIEALKHVPPLHGMEQCELEWLAMHGIERKIPAGTTLFHEGDTADRMLIMLKGEIHVRRERGAAAALFIGRTAMITGLLPFSRMKTYGGQGIAVTDLWGLEYPREIFPEMTKALPSMTQRCVGVLLDRVREITRLEQQAEKLNALGKLAGNLAHEMNNPASAAQRAASGLLDELRVYGHEKYRLGGLCLDEEHIVRVRDWQDSVRGQRKMLTRDSTQHAALEDSLHAWLKNHGVNDTWKIAPELAELGVNPEQLEPLEFLRHQEEDRTADAGRQGPLRAAAGRGREHPQAPTQLSAVINRLEEDHEYLTEGGVLTSDLIETWINFKRDNEILRFQIRPHPYEFALYYDV